MGSSNCSGRSDLQPESTIVSRESILASVLSKEAIPESFFEHGMSSRTREMIAMVFDPVRFQPPSSIVLLFSHTPVRIWNHTASKEGWYGVRLVRFSGRLRRLSRSRRKLRLSRCVNKASCHVTTYSLSVLASRFALGSDPVAKRCPHNNQSEHNSYRTVHQSDYYRLWSIKNGNQWHSTLLIVRRGGIQRIGYPFAWRLQGWS